MIFKATFLYKFSQKTSFYNLENVRKGKESRNWEHVVPNTP